MSTYGSYDTIHMSLMSLLRVRVQLTSDGERGTDSSTIIMKRKMPGTGSPLWPPHESHPFHSNTDYVICSFVQSLFRTYLLLCVRCCGRSIWGTWLLVEAKSLSLGNPCLLSPLFLKLLWSEGQLWHSINRYGGVTLFSYC